MVLTASTIAFQAIGTGSNPVTRSNYLRIATPEKSTLLQSNAAPEDDGISLFIYIVKAFSLSAVSAHKSSHTKSGSEPPLLDSKVGSKRTYQ